jgi:cell wall-associated NlpC family hydrolase
MTVKLLVIFATVLSVNVPPNLPEEIVVAKPAVEQVAPKSFRTIALLDAKEIKQQAKRDKLKRVVNYLTTRVHKTSYVFSGSSISGWDCSGMVRYAYKRLGITLEHSADKQAHSGVRVSKPRIGDIVVFAYNGSKSFYHSAIYVGSGLVVNANLMYKTTVIQPLSDFRNSQIRFVRVIK